MRLSDTILPLLTVCGIVCTVIAAIFGVFHDYKEQSGSRLKLSGKLVLTVSLLGGVIAISAAILDTKDENAKTRKILTELARSLHPLGRVRTFYTVRVEAPELLRNLPAICPAAGQKNVLITDPAILARFRDVIMNTRVNLSFHITHPTNAFSQRPCSDGEVIPGCLDLNFASGGESRVFNYLYLNTCNGGIWIGGQERGFLWGNAGLSSLLDLPKAEMAVFGATNLPTGARPAPIENVGVSFAESAPLGGTPPSFWTKATLIEHPDWPAYTHVITNSDLKQCCSLDPAKSVQP